MSLSPFEKTLCVRLQEGLAICERPFDRIAQQLGVSQSTVLEGIRSLQASGVIRRFGPVINARALGRISTLVTAHVPDQRIQAVADRISALEGVSHNYLRRHHHNLWFTLQAGDQHEIQRKLEGLTRQTGVMFFDLATERIFKLEMLLDPDGMNPLALQSTVQVPSTAHVQLSELDKRLLQGLQQGIALIPDPFSAYRSDDDDMQAILQGIQRLVRTGVIRRIGAVVHHRRLGFTANALLVLQVPAQESIEAGQSLARYRAVSHCYTRRSYAPWPYTHYAMMHGLNHDSIQSLADHVTQDLHVRRWELLWTEREFKKQPVVQRF